MYFVPNVSSLFWSSHTSPSIWKCIGYLPNRKACPACVTSMWSKCATANPWPLCGEWTIIWTPNWSEPRTQEYNGQYLEFNEANTHLNECCMSKHSKRTLLFYRQFDVTWRRIDAETTSRAYWKSAFVSVLSNKGWWAWILTSFMMIHMEKRHAYPVNTWRAVFKSKEVESTLKRRRVFTG